MYLRVYILFASFPPKMMYYLAEFENHDWWLLGDWTEENVIWRGALCWIAILEPLCSALIVFKAGMLSCHIICSTWTCHDFRVFFQSEKAMPSAKSWCMTNWGCTYVGVHHISSPLKLYEQKFSLIKRCIWPFILYMNRFNLWSGYY